MNFRSTLHPLAIVALLVPLAACEPSIGDATESDSNADTGTDPSDPSGTPTSGPDEFGPCSANNPCPDGQFCWNGLCALGCTNNGDCADDQYCATDTDMLCHNKTVETCPAVACPDGQECVNGFCSAAEQPATVCEQMPNGEDGCAKDALCYSETGEPSDNKCYTFPACAEDDTCPTGTIGAVCNVGLLPSKGRICLIGACTETKHCPADAACISYDGPIGACSFGEFGDLCNTNADCNSGNCAMDFPGEAGFCL